MQKLYVYMIRVVALPNNDLVTVTKSSLPSAASRPQSRAAHLSEQAVLYIRNVHGGKVRVPPFFVFSRLQRQSSSHSLLHLATTAQEPHIFPSTLHCTSTTTVLSIPITGTHKEMVLLFAAENLYTAYALPLCGSS